MSARPSNPELLTDRDVLYAPFHCCGDEDLLFLRCPACTHIMVLCYECDTLYPNLTDTSQSDALTLTGPEDRFRCPRCGRSFEDPDFLREGNVDKYLPTAAQVRQAGFGHLLASHHQEAGTLAERVATAKRVRCLSIPERRVLFETSDQATITQLSVALHAVPAQAFHCMCIGTLNIEVEGPIPLTFTVHHGISVRVGSGGEGDLLLRDPSALMRWLSDHGIPFVQEEHDALVRHGEQTRAEAERWRSRLPSSLAPFFDEMWRSGGSKRPEWSQAVEAEFPDPVQRARVLLDLFGRGVGPWSGFPSWEAVPEEILLGLPLPVLLEAVGEAPGPDRCQGAARLFCGWHFKKRRKRDLARIPEAVRMVLFQHVEAVGDDSQRRRVRAVLGSPRQR